MKEVQRKMNKKDDGSNILSITWCLFEVRYFTYSSVTVTPDFWLKSTRFQLKQRTIQCAFAYFNPSPFLYARFSFAICRAILRVPVKNEAGKTEATS